MGFAFADSLSNGPNWVLLSQTPSWGLKRSLSHLHLFIPEVDSFMYVQGSLLSILIFILKICIMDGGGGGWMDAVIFLLVFQYLIRYIDHV